VAIALFAAACGSGDDASFEQRSKRTTTSAESATSTEASTRSWARAGSARRRRFSSRAARM
jgi:hypothetical protein